MYYCFFQRFVQYMYKRHLLQVRQRLSRDTQRTEPTPISLREEMVDVPASDPREETVHEALLRLNRD
jgi:hypothetical protein